MTALMYHDIVAAGEEDTSGFPGRDAAIYKVAPEAFAAHLDAIRGALSLPDLLLSSCAGAPPPARTDADASPRISTSSARRGRRRSPPALVITFDDGGSSALAAADALERRGFVGHFFVTVNYIGTRGFAGAGDIAELRRRGHVIGSHSCSHPLRMARCSWTQLLEEWARSRSVLSDILGEDVDVASVPGGDFAPTVAEAAARAGFTRLFTSEPTRRARTAFGLRLVGRFTIQKWTSPATVAALAAGAWLPCARQALVWNAKKLTKRVAGDRYLQMRRLLLRHGNEVRWGDMR